MFAVSVHVAVPTQPSPIFSASINFHGGCLPRRGLDRGGKGQVYIDWWRGDGDECARANVFACENAIYNATH